jgi:hypothetical protein
MPYKPDPYQVKAFISESMKEYNPASPERKKELAAIVKDGVSRYSSLLADITEEDYKDGIRGLALQNMSVMFAAGKKFLALIQTDRQQLIDSGKVWQVYPEGQTENILFEGTKTACKEYLSKHNLNRSYKKGLTRLAQVIWEANSTNGKKK